MNVFKSLGLVALSVLAVSTVSSCEEHNPFSEKELFEQEYSKNFFAEYGTFPANQSWDFSNMPRTAATDPSVFDLGWKGGSAVTRAAGDIDVNIPTGDGGWYNVPESALTWLKNNLVEGENNTSKGKPFSLVYDNANPTSNKFALIPIYKGSACLKWQLCLHTSTKDVVLWDPWDGRDINDEKMKGLQYFNQKGDCYDMPLRADMGERYWTEEEATTYNTAHADEIAAGTLSAVAKGEIRFNEFRNLPRSRPIIVSNISGEFSLYLKLTHCLPGNDVLNYFKETVNDLTEGVDTNPKNEEHYTYDCGWLRGYGTKGQTQFSTAGMMLALDCDDIISNLDLNSTEFKNLVGISSTETINNVMILGCEDCSTGISDWDINDIVFLMVGLTELPQKREALSKRYLIEDLGSTVDWDFNDVVVDVTETYLLDGEGNRSTTVSQEAIVKHLCGTVPFEVSFIGDGSTYANNATFGTIQGEVQGLHQEYKNADGSYKKRLTYVQGTGLPFWNSSTNNIKIDVGSNGTLTGENWSSQLHTAGFSDPGDTNAPYIIAVPLSQMWTEENGRFPFETFKGWTANTANGESNN